LANLPQSEGEYRVYSLANVRLSKRFRWDIHSGVILLRVTGWLVRYASERRAGPIFKVRIPSCSPETSTTIDPVKRTIPYKSGDVKCPLPCGISRV